LSQAPTLAIYFITRHTDALLLVVLCHFSFPHWTCLAAVMLWPLHARFINYLMLVVYAGDGASWQCLDIISIYSDCLLHFWVWQQA
jgi:hypothetical protein